MKKIKMIYERIDKVVQDEYIIDYKNYDKSNLAISFKIDGSASMIKDGRLYKRYDAHLKQISLDQSKDGIFCYKNEYHNIYGVPVNQTDYYHLLAGNNLKDKKDGTYELVGPYVNSNRHQLTNWYLIPHKDMVVGDSNITNVLSEQDGINIMLDFEANLFPSFNKGDLKKIEGFVLGDKDKKEPMFKIRKSDLGLEWGSIKDETGFSLLRKEIREMTSDIFDKYIAETNK